MTAVSAPHRQARTSTSDTRRRCSRSSRGVPASLTTWSGPAKERKYWALDPDSGAVQWVTQAAPGGTAGGLQWGSAVDDPRVYTANANSNFVPWTLQPGGTTSTTKGVWSGLDAVTGAVPWQTTPPNGGASSGPVTTANGIVFGCSLDALGYMYALNGATGAVLRSFPSGGSCPSGAAISNGTVYWGSCYSNFGFGTPTRSACPADLMRRIGSV